MIDLTVSLRYLAVNLRDSFVLQEGLRQAVIFSSRWVISRTCG